MHLDYNQGEQHQLRSNIVLVLSLSLLSILALALALSLSPSLSLLLSLNVEPRLLVINNLVILLTLLLSLST